MVPTFDEDWMIWENVMLSTGCGWESLNILAPIFSWSSTLITSVGVVTLVSNAAAAVTILLTDPGSRTSTTARLRREEPSLDFRSFGLKAGLLAMARMLPFFGFMTI